ncbi:hypothetical protein CANARDRAFT_193344 [[Candida] arabinofermentans NRRL YB-2248]|uniref:Aminopeptidase n=1 Tax=[Candida] arabinofermentans NRRL YB-2248 TaxID=983967 RepID=A0A1E4T854_9ASCO|nr:hypothetical protein CANARDRAFT_193344 [[Candida] arabinofermentans NRRL YB-2248]
MCTSTIKYPDSSIHQALPADVKAQHYKLHFSNIDSEANTFSGLTSIQLDILKDINSIKLNQKYLNIISAKAILNITKTEIEIPIITTIKDDIEETVEFKFGEKLSNGSITLIINYNGKIRTDMGGFYNSSYTGENGELQTILCTQFEAVDARSAFPCYDEPNAKATFDVSLTVDSSLEVLGNMPILHSKTLDDGKKGPPQSSTDGNTDLKLVTFQTTPLMSTYLLAWTIGKFEYVEGFTKTTNLPIRIYTIPGQSKNGEFALSVAIKAVEYLSKIFDVEYPLPKLDLVAVPAFGANAMENWGLVVFRSTALLYDPIKSDAKYMQKVAYVVSHEISHSWFGNYCTMNWWSDLWLNESFATYVGWLCVDSMYPNWKVFTDFISTATGKAMDLDSLRNSHPVEVQVYYAKEIDEIFDAISYLKGGSIVRMVAESIGIELFLKGVSNYLKKYSFGNAKSNDLWDAISDVSGENITTLVEPWIRSVGFPYLSVKHVDNDNNLQITQQRFLSSGDVKSQEDQIIWWIPNESMTGKTKIIPSDGFLKLNKDSIGFYRVIYEESLLNNIIENLDKLSSEDKIGLVADTLAGSQAGLVKSSQFLKLISSMKNEDDFAVWLEIAGRLSSLKDLFFDDDKTLSQLSDFAKDLYGGKFLELIEKPTDSLSFLETNLRSLLFSLTGTAGLSKTLEFAKSSIQLNEIEPSLRQGVFISLLSNKETCTKENFQLVLNDVLKPSSIDSRELALGALGLVAKPEEFSKQIFELYFSKSLPEMDYLFLTMSLVSNPLTKKLFWEFFKDNFTKFKSETAMWTLDRMIKSFLPYLSSEELLVDVSDFFSKVETTGFDKGLKQGLDAIQTNVEWIKRDRESVKEWLTSAGY